MDNKKLIIFLVIVVLGIIVYNLYKNKDKTTNTDVTGSNGSTSNITNYTGYNPGPTNVSTTPVTPVVTKQYVYSKSSNSAPIKAYSNTIGGSYSNVSPGGFVGEYKETIISGGSEWYKTTGGKFTLKVLSELKGVN